MIFSFTHCNLTVADLERSLNFYKQALSLTEIRRLDFGDCIMTYLTDDNKNFELELRWNKESDKHIELGDNPTHIALMTEDVQKALELHQSMGCVSSVVSDLGIYFINDPDGYIIEIMPNDFFKNR